MRTVTRRRLLVSGAAVLAGTAIPACGREPSTDRAHMETVTVLTGAGFQGREAPLLVARANGWFRAEGVAVEVLPGKGSGENLKLLAAGQVDVATLDVNAAMIEASTPGGIHDFRLTSVLHQRNLACFVALASSGIRTPGDLAGRRLSYLPGGINHVLFPTYAQLAGFDPSAVRWVSNPVPAQHAALLAAGQVDAISQFVPAVESVRSVAQQDVTVLPFVDYIGDLHGSAMAVSTATATDRADVIRRFNRALLRGLEFCMEQPDAAGTAYAAQPETQGQQSALAAAELTALRGYVTPVEGRLGHFDMARVARNIAILHGAGAIPAGLTPPDIIAPDLVE
ncbi:ABC transporter substrate-binding protein [Solwaraspora sp. WMMD406]|uniref:ABC transporter substrate-binding protein n=1 Tax=Solwaraspora sp. WMMD406 TaxID=3016095 RepID=UPI002416B936|nr:ABC transporter substrate-binding protein [Solwaraspora sp. WMMD406]MDG4764450.1 ABC transporter substrate-binding protein [Solwaraspora sp. WMMD406]